MTDTHARARVWTLCLAALVLCALTGPVAALLTPLAHASARGTRHNRCGGDRTRHNRCGST